MIFNTVFKAYHELQGEGIQREPLQLYHSKNELRTKASECPSGVLYVVYTIRLYGCLVGGDLWPLANPYTDKRGPREDSRQAHVVYGVYIPCIL